MLTDRVQRALHFDYTTVGHVTIDVMEDGTRRAGGAAFYSALQAARLGKRALIVTQGVPEEIEELLAAYRGELELTIMAAAQTTTLATVGSGAARVQRVLAWAGPIEPQIEHDTAILHLAPVARETPSEWRGEAAFVGLTPQGLARRWARLGGQITLAPPPERAQALASRVDAVALNALEQQSCAGLIDAASRAGALVAITDGERPCRLLLPGGEVHVLEIPALAEPLEDLGAGDVFAAALFTSLAEGSPALAAAGFATAAAAVRMSGRGAAAVGERRAIERRYAAAGPVPG
jgi:1D-myo-inositol 3-kinase